MGSSKTDPSDSVKRLLAAQKYRAAADVLTEKGRPHELSPEDRADLALAWTYLQKEEEAATLIHDIPYEGCQAHSNLARYFAARAKVVTKIKMSDIEGKKWAVKYKNHPDFKPECKLSATLIVKNEARHIERCLASVRDLVDEIVLVDTGSTDDTVALAKAAAGETPLIVGEFAWIHDFSAARNYALSLATGDWALWIDADEELRPESEGEIRQALIRPYFGGFHLRIVNYTADGNDASTYVHMPLRLFRRLPETKFEGKIHENPSESLLALGLPLGNLESATILHYGYRPSEMTEKNKQERFITMLETEVRENPEDGFQWFNLANAYTVFDRAPEAMHAARSAIKVATDDLMVLPHCYMLLAGALTKLGRPEEALEALDEAAGRGITDLFTEFERALALIKLERPTEALSAIDKSLTLAWPSHSTGDFTVFSYKRHLVRGQALALLGRCEEALLMFDYALDVEPTCFNAMYMKGVTLAGLGRHEEALPLFKNASIDPALTGLALQGEGKSLMHLSRFGPAVKAFEAAWNLAPQSYDAWLDWANACEAAKDLDTIVRAYSAFAKQNEPSPAMLVNWGRTLDRAGQHQRALEIFSEALKRDPSDANAYFNCGDLLYRFGHYQDAAFLFETGLRLDPEHKTGWLVLGNSLAQLGFVDVAKKSFEQALVLDPEYHEARHNLEVLAEPLAG